MVSLGRWVGRLAAAVGIEGWGVGADVDGIALGMGRGGETWTVASNRSSSASWSSMKLGSARLLFHARVNRYRNNGLGNEAICTGVPVVRRVSNCI